MTWVWPIREVTKLRANGPSRSCVGLLNVELPKWLTTVPTNSPIYRLALINATLLSFRRTNLGVGHG